MKSNKIISMIKRWNHLKFEENPYGEKIPDIFLDSKKILSSGMCLRNQRQNGFIVSKVINDRNKTSPAEEFNDVLLAPIFERLWQNEELCPSNYVSEVIFELTLYEMQHNLSFSHEFYCAFIARSLRAFASYIREKSLEVIIYDFFTEYCLNNNYHFILGAADKIEEDIKNKTDILVTIENVKYRIWSFQSTKAGCKCTKRRALHCKKGVNIFIPFNIDERLEVYGWFLYNKDKVISNLLTIKTEKFAHFKKELEKNESTLKKLHKVFVA